MARSLLIHCGQTSAESFRSIESMYSHCKFESVRIPKSPSFIKRAPGRTPLKPPLLYYCPFAESRKWKKKNGRKICGFVSLPKGVLALSMQEKNRSAASTAERLSENHKLPT